MPKEKESHTATEDSAPGSNCPKKWCPSQRSTLDLAAFTLAKISVALHHVSKGNLAMHNMECPSLRD